MFPVQSAQQWSLYDFEWGGGGLYCQLCSGITIAAAALAFNVAVAAAGPSPGQHASDPTSKCQHELHL